MHMHTNATRILNARLLRRGRLVGLLGAGLLLASFLAPERPCVVPLTSMAMPGAYAETPAVDDAGALVSNVFADTDLRQALADLASQAKVTIIPDNTVQGTVTMEINSMPLERALGMILLPGGYAYAKSNGYYLVGAPETTNPNYYMLVDTKIVDLKYTDTSTVLSMLGASYGRYLSAMGSPAQGEPDEERNAEEGNMPRRTIDTASFTPPSTTTNRRSDNRILISAPRFMIERIQNDIQQIDQPRSQVMLEATVMEVSEETLNTLGVDWATRFLRQDLTSGGPNLIYSKVANTEIAALTALVQRGGARLRANPRIATVDGQTAELEVGKESYFSIVSGPVTYPYTTLERINSGILFRITPRIVMPEREIMASIEPEVRDVTGRGANGLPEITYRRASTNLSVRDGQSIVIGGLVSEFDTRVVNKTPILGDLPLVGFAFRRTSTHKTRTEVVIIITPHILIDGQLPGATDLTGATRPVSRTSLLRNEVDSTK